MTEVHARQRRAAGALFALQILSDFTQAADGPEVAVDADGDAVAAWRQFDGAKHRIEAAIGP